MSTMVQPQLKLINEWRQFVQAMDEATTLATRGSVLRNRLAVVQTKNLSAEHCREFEENRKVNLDGDVLVAQSKVLISTATIAWYDAVIATYGENAVVIWDESRNLGISDCMIDHKDIYEVEMGRQQAYVNPKLLEAWKKRIKLIDEGWKLISEGNDLSDSQSGSHDAKNFRVVIDGDALVAKGKKCIADADVVWLDAVIEVYGKDINIRWSFDDDSDATGCILGNGETYTASMGRE